MALASIPGKLQEYTSTLGLNTIELDVKDENGEVAFHTLAPPLARRIGSAMRYYDPKEVAASLHKQGIYLIGRVVLRRPDPVPKRPDLAIRTTGGGVWVNHAGLGWTNPYDKRVWNYNLDVAKAAVRAGFDEIQFDYVRFPSDGPIESAVFRGKRREPMATTIAQFVHYATNRLRPMGARVSVDLFGLSARRNLGVGQSPRRLSKIVDSISQWSIPLTTVPANTGLRVRSRPRERPSDDRCGTSADRCAAARHSSFRGSRTSASAGTTTLAHVQEQIRAAQERCRRIPALESIRQLHDRSVDHTMSHKERLTELRERLGVIHDFKRAGTLGTGTCR